MAGEAMTALGERLLRVDLDRFLVAIPEAAGLDRLAFAADTLAGSLAYEAGEGRLDAGEACALLRESLAFLDDEAMRTALGLDGYAERKDAVARVLAYAARGRIA